MRLVRNASVFSNGVAVKREICWAMYVIDEGHKLWTGRDAEFTSIVDGMHSPKSLHYKGLAVDLRIWYVKETNKLVEAVELLLGENYDVVDEGTHLHIEFEPNRESIK